MEWVDPETGYQCTIRRSRTGSLCGYVDVPEGHVWHGIDYSGCVNRHAPKTREERLAGLREDVVAAKRRVEQEPADALHRSALRLAEMHLEAVEEEGSFMYDYAEYPYLDYNKEDCCNSPEAIIEVHGGLTYSGLNEDSTWCYGFDCAHCGDYMPAMEATLRKLHIDRSNPFSDPNATFDPRTGIKHEHGLDEAYRDMSYVKKEVESLAKQLYEVNRV